MTRRLHFHFSLSSIGGGHGNPLQCSCLENPRDGGAWWAAVYGVAQSRTRLKRLRRRRRRRRRYFLYLKIVEIIFALFFFKYAGFFSFLGKEILLHTQ